MNASKKKERGGLFRKYFLVFFGVIWVPVVVFCVVLYTTMARRMETELTGKLGASAEAVKSGIDAQITHIDGDLTRLSLDLSNDDLLRISVTYEQRMRLLAQLRHSLETTAGTSRVIDTIGVYFSVQEKVLSDKGYYSHGRILDWAPIYAVRNAEETSGFFAQYRGDGQLQLVAAKSIPLVASRSANFVYLTVDMRRLSEMMRAGIVGAVCAISDAEGKILAMNGAEGRPASFQDLPMLLKAHPGALHAGVLSDVLPWTYTVLLPASAAAETNRLLSTMSLIVVLLSVLGCLFSYYLASAFYKPIHQLVGAARARMEGLLASKPGCPQNDLLFLREAVETLTDYGEALKRSVSSGRSRVVGSILRHLLDGSRLVREEVFETLENYSFDPAGLTFLVVLMELRSDALDKRWDGWMYRYLTENRIGALLPEAAVGEMAVVDMGNGRLCAVIGAKTPEALDMPAFLGALLQHLSAEWGSARLCFGGAAEDIMSIDLCYEKAIRAVSRAAALNAHCVVDADGSAPGKQDVTARLDIPLLERLSNQLLAEDAEGLRATLASWYQRAVSAKATLGEVRSDALQIAGHIRMVALQSLPDCDIAPAPFTLEDTLACPHVESLHAGLAQYAMAAMESLRAGASSRSRGRAVSAIAYVNANFRQDISLTQAADQLGISPQHLSLTFKNETGRGFTEYVNDRRLHEACRLLRDTKTSVQDIAEGVGYNSVQYFARKFKEQFGVTPSQYRGTAL